MRLLQHLQCLNINIGSDNPITTTLEIGMHLRTVRPGLFFVRARLSEFDRLLCCRLMVFFVRVRLSKRETRKLCAQLNQYGI